MTEHPLGTECFGTSISAPIEHGQETAFAIRELSSGVGWVIDATPVGQTSQQLIGVFTSSKAAEEWIRNGLKGWPGRYRQAE